MNLITNRILLFTTRPLIPNIDNVQFFLLRSAARFSTSHILFRNHHGDYRILGLCVLYLRRFVLCLVSALVCPLLQWPQVSPLHNGEREKISPGQYRSCWETQGSWIGFVFVSITVRFHNTFLGPRVLCSYTELHRYWTFFFFPLLG